MRKLIMFLPAICFMHHAFAQKDEKVTMEEVKQECANLPMNERARLSVTKFSVTTSASNATNATVAPVRSGLWGGILSNSAPAKGTAGYIPPAIGDNLTSMLTNALQNVNCYDVLESLSNNQDLTQEIDAGNGAYSSKKAPKAGKQLGAQIVVTGEVTEYSVDHKVSQIMGVGTSKEKVKIGFILKMINPETREIIISREFRAQSRTNKTASILGLSTNGESDPAVAAVMEDAVVDAVQTLAKWRDSLHITAKGDFVGNTQSSPNGVNSTDITISNANYSAYTSFAKMLSGLHEFKSMDKSFSGGVATFSVSHTGTTDALMDDINKLIDPAKYDVKGVEDGKIDMVFK